MNPTTTSKNLGQISSFYSGTVAPTNTALIWYNPTTNVWQTWNNVSNTWIPLPTGTPPIPPNTNLGKIYFVSFTNGDDSDAQVGNLLKPWKTVVGALGQASVDGTSISEKAQIVIMPGNYAENISLNLSYVTIKPFTLKNELFKDVLNKQQFDLLSTHYTYCARDVKISSLEISEVTEGVELIGLDLATLTINRSSPNNGYFKRNLYQNLLCGVINFGSTGQPSPSISGNFIDIVSKTWFGTNTADMQYCYFEKIVVLNGFSPLMKISHSIFKNCVFDRTNDLVDCSLDNVRIFGKAGVVEPLRDIIDCVIFDSYLADGSVRYATNCLIERTKGGKDCLKTFENLTMKHCEFTQFGNSALLPVSGYLTGDFDDVEADYTGIGFVNGRPFYGKLRNMEIKISINTKPCINVKKPIGMQPMNIEYCTIMNCSASGNTVVGDAGFISFCKLNKIWTSVNGLGTPTDSFNIISTQLCNYIP